MVDPSVKVAKLQLQRSREESAVALAKSVIENPVVDFLAGLVVVSYLFNRQPGEHWTAHLSNDLAQGAIGVGLAAICANKALGPGGSAGNSLAKIL